MNSRQNLPQPDVFIAALGRSGSTLLANLMTTPPSRWVLIEPRFADGSTGVDVLTQAVEFGIDVSATEWQQQDSESPRDRNERVFSTRLQALGRWGLKEVRPDLLWGTIEMLQPKYTIVQVRDLRDAAVSLSQKSEVDPDSIYGEDWQRSYLSRSATTIVDLVDSLPAERHCVVRYEDLVGNRNYRTNLEKLLDWPLDGDPSRHLAQLYDRGREVRLHQGRVTDLAVNRAMESASPEARRLAEWVVREVPEFQRRFSYEI